MDIIQNIILSKLPNGEYLIETKDGLFKIIQILKTLKYDKEFIKTHKNILKVPFKNKHKIIAIIHKNIF